MKHLKALMCLMAIMISFASCGDDDSDDPKKLSAEDALVTNTVFDAVDNAVNDALSTPPAGKISSINAEILKAGEDDVNYDKDGLKITGTRDNLVITLTNFSTKATDENGTEHTLVVSGELKADRSFDEATESEVTERTGSITVTFDGVDHTIETDLTITRTHSAEGESDEETVGTVTFDGTECEYEG